MKSILQVFLKGIYMFKDGEDLKTLLPVRHMEESDGRQHYCKMTRRLRGVIPFPNKPCVLTCLQNKSLKNTLGKGEIARNEQFLLFPQCFLYFQRTFRHFHLN